MQPPPDLVRGCNRPDGLPILADWLDEHDQPAAAAEFRAADLSDTAEMPRNGYGYGGGYGDGGYGDGYGNGGGDGDGYGE